MLQAGVVFAGERLLLTVPAFAAMNVVLVGAWLGVVGMINATSARRTAKAAVAPAVN